ncbi:MAG: hydantoinase/oxoprolinase family protein [Pseudomonadota bacterium]
MKRLGIDVGGTHTDAVALDGDAVIAAHKASTSADVSTGILDAIDHVLASVPGGATEIEAVMLGTTQFTNAVVERREMAPVAAVRIGAPSGRGVPPKIGWPADLVNATGSHVYELTGGYLYDGWPLAAMDDAEIDRTIEDIKAKGIPTVAVTSVFSPMQPSPELRFVERLRQVVPDISVTTSHSIGRLGILERENAAILNAALLPFSSRVIDAFEHAIRERGLSCPFFVSQNDGTLMNATFARRFPALTFASGPTNSLRGACRLSGLEDAIVVDIGGTTSDIGVLQGGFPRESNMVIEVGGVRTNFRMPDIQAIGLGGGSIIADSGDAVGPQSVGHALTSEALVFGGEVLTATDVAVARGYAEIGDSAHVASLPQHLLDTVQMKMQRLLSRAIDRMKPGRDEMPVVLVGGGGVIVGDDMDLGARIVRPPHAGVANAIGAALAQVGAEHECMVDYERLGRDRAINEARSAAMAAGRRAGADPSSMRVSDIEETAMSYMPGSMTRLRVKVVGDIARGSLHAD